MADLAFVDTHIHLWDQQHPDLAYSWLEPDAVHPILGDIDAIKFPLYDAAAFTSEVAGANVTKAVHVQAAIGIEDPVDETRWLHAQAEASGIPLAIVAYANLKDPGLEAELARHAEASPHLRGIRDFSEGDYLVDDDFARGYALLGEHDLVCDVDCFWQNMTKARDLAQRHPGTTMILDHAGFPLERTAEYQAQWRRGITTLAEAESAWCKISGLGMGDPQWSVDSIRPWVLGCIEAFGVERCFFGSNWPVDKLFSPYAKVVDAYAEIVSDFSRDEQVALLSGNAERVYRF